VGRRGAEGFDYGVAVAVVAVVVVVVVDVEEVDEGRRRQLEGRAGLLFFLREIGIRPTDNKFRKEQENVTYLDRPPTEAMLASLSFLASCTRSFHSSWSAMSCCKTKENKKQNKVNGFLRFQGGCGGLG